MGKRIVVGRLVIQKQHKEYADAYSLLIYIRVCRMKSYKGYLIDLDGTIFKGIDVIPGAKEFIKKLKNKNIPYVFITNNSALTAESLVNRLNKMDIPATKENILTSSIATAKYLKQDTSNVTCFIIGEEGLSKALKDEDIQISNHNVTHVVMGIDRQVTYEKLASAASFVRKGAHFISTNKDLAIPSDEGIIPGNGALTSVVSLTTGIKPLFMGKPAKSMIQIGLDMLNCSADEVVLIGDNYFTDILGGIQSGVDTAFVLTGIGKVTDIDSSLKPTYIYKDLLAQEII